MPELNPIAAPGDDALENGQVSACPPGNGNLYVRIVDVGVGNCAYIICPNGKRLLIDCGSTDTGDRTTDDIAEELDYYDDDDDDRFLYVDVLVLSHGHQDHYNLIWNLVGGSPMQVLYYGGTINGYNGSTGFRRWWQQRVTVIQQQLNVNAANTDPVMLVDGTQGAGPACEIWAIAATVAPPAGGDRSIQNTKNTNSIVIKIEFGVDSILICADATADTENWMRGNPQSNARLPSNILVVPHHGSDTSSTQDFIDRVAPQTAIISASNHNNHGLPRLSIANRYIAAPGIIEHMDEHNLGTYDDVTPRPARTKPPYDDLDIQQDLWQTGSTDEYFHYTFTGT